MSKWVEPQTLISSTSFWNFKNDQSAKYDYKDYVYYYKNNLPFLESDLEKFKHSNTHHITFNPYCFKSNPID